MDYQNKNEAIECSVSSCAYHANDKDVCSLHNIKVSHCGPTTSDCACTECASYQLSKKTSR